MWSDAARAAALAVRRAQGSLNDAPSALGHVKEAEGRLPSHLRGGEISRDLDEAKGHIERSIDDGDSSHLDHAWSSLRHAHAMLRKDNSGDVMKAARDAQIHIKGARDAFAKGDKEGAKSHASAAHQALQDFSNERGNPMGFEGPEMHSDDPQGHLRSASTATNHLKSELGRGNPNSVSVGHHLDHADDALGGFITHRAASNLSQDFPVRPTMSHGGTK